MGNYVSCALSSQVAAGLSAASAEARVVLPGGEVRRVEGPVTAAEVMLERPGFFVADARSVRIGGRFAALAADEDLEMSAVYVMIPMKRLNSLVTTADMAPAFLAATKKTRPRRAPKGSSNKAKRVLPAEPEEADDVAPPAPKLDLDDVEDFSSPEFMHRLSMSRSKKPLLETIVEEEPVCLRS